MLLDDDTYTTTNKQTNMPSKKSTRNNAKAKKPVKVANADDIIHRLDNAGIEEQRFITAKFVDGDLMPHFIKEAADNFDKPEAKTLLIKMREEMVKYFISRKWWREHGNMMVFSYGHGRNNLSLKSEDGETLVIAHLEKPMPTVLSRTDCKKELFEHVADRRKTAARKETYFTYHRKLETGSWGTNEDLRIEMKNWKQQKKDGVIEMIEGNKNSFEINGKTYYTLAITQLDGNGEAVAIGFDRFGFGMGHVVSGIMYWFASEENRDAVMKYVME
jgi:hypothetical protein